MGNNSEIEKKAKEFVNFYAYDKFEGIIPVGEYVDFDSWAATNVNPDDVNKVKERIGALLSKKYYKRCNDEELVYEQGTPDAGTHADDDKSLGDDSLEDPYVDIDLVREALRPLLNLDPGDAAIIFWHRYFGISPDVIVKIIASLPKGRMAIYNRIEKARKQLRDPDHLLKKHLYKR